MTSPALVGSSTVIRHVQHLVHKFADINPVLIIGEQGTGCQGIADALHQQSEKFQYPLHTITCESRDGFLPEYLPQYLEKHHTFFLVDIIKLSVNDQKYLLEVIKKHPDYRWIVSGLPEIETMVHNNTFDQDLYYRLAGACIFLPPLRERKEDIPHLIEFYIQKYNRLKSKSVKGIAQEAVFAFMEHAWNHNIAELDNLIERLVILKSSGFIEVCDLPPRLRNLITDNINEFYEKTQIPISTMDITKTTHLVPLKRSPFPKEPYPTPAFEESSHIDQFIKKEIDLGSGIDFYRVVEEFENRLIAEALRRTNHNKNRAAQLLSMNRTTLVEKLKKRVVSSTLKLDGARMKRNSMFTIYDGLGGANQEFEGASDFLPLGITDVSND